MAATPNCDMTNSSDGKTYYADCSNKTLFKFPQGLGKNLKVFSIHWLSVLIDFTIGIDLNTSYKHLNMCCCTKYIVFRIVLDFKYIE